MPSNLNGLANMAQYILSLKVPSSSSSSSSSSTTTTTITDPLANVRTIGGTIYTDESDVTLDASLDTELGANVFESNRRYEVEARLLIRTEAQVSQVSHGSHPASAPTYWYPEHLPPREEVAADDVRSCRRGVAQFLLKHPSHLAPGQEAPTAEDLATYPPSLAEVVWTSPEMKKWAIAAATEPVAPVPSPIIPNSPTVPAPDRAWGAGKLWRSGWGSIPLAHQLMVERQLTKSGIHQLIRSQVNVRRSIQAKLSRVERYLVERGETLEILKRELTQTKATVRSKERAILRLRTQLAKAKNSNNNANSGAVAAKPSGIKKKAAAAPAGPLRRSARIKGEKVGE